MVFNRPLKQFKINNVFIGKFVLILLATGILFLFHSSATASAQKAEKKILLLFSGQSDIPAYPLILKGIKSGLEATNAFRFEYFIEYMDRYRSTDQTYYQQLLDIYRHKYSGRTIDLVITTSVPALRLMIDHGNEITSQAPIVFTAVPASYIETLGLRENITGVVGEMDYTGQLEIALKIHPRTRHVVIINGTSNVELFMEKQFRNAFEPYTSRLNFIYLSDLPLGELTEKVKKLPDDSIVLFYLMMLDAAGQSHVPVHILPDLTKAANAPVYGAFDLYLGRGIVGGRLYSYEMLGVKAGENGLRILQGARPSDIPISGQGTHLNVFDWRELKRWGISEDRLPPDSIVRFKTPSFWEAHRWQIITAIFLIVFGYGFISLLLIQQKRLRRQFRFEQMLSNLSARFVNLSPDQVGSQIERELEMISRLLAVDRISVFEISEDTLSLIVAYSFAKTDIEETPAQIEFSRLAWGRQRILNGEMVIFSHPDELPVEAEAEKEYFHSLGVQSGVVIPLSAGQSTLGLLTLAMLRHRRKWPQGLTRQFGLVAEVFANAIARKRSEQALVASENFNQSTLNSLNFHIVVLDREGRILDVNESWLRFARENDAESLDRIGTGINYLEVCRRGSDNGDEFALKALEGIQSVLSGTREQFWLEYPCDSPVEKCWFLMRVTRFLSRIGGVIISHVDITERKLAEIELQNAYTQIEQLKDQLEAEKVYLQEEIKLEHDFEAIIGNSPAIEHVLFKVQQVAATDTTVLVLGETGTGKELVARAIHSKSLRKQHPLVKVNCAALPSNLIESELFGHERGAFTSAQTRQIGRFEVANGTTIFLDEIGDLPLEQQTKLLQVLQDGQFERLGDPRTIKVDVRVIAATNRDLEAQVRKGEFRKDLFYRLNVFPLTVPPLRDRIEDIPLLAEFFMKKASKRIGKTIQVIPTSVIKKLKNYPWPGNVRELENVIERGVISSSGPKLRLAEELVSRQKDDWPTALKTMQAIEFDHIGRVLEYANWKISGKNGAAEILGLKRGTLIARMKKLGIRKP